MAFDINGQDLTGQTILYISSFLGNFKIVDLLLNFKVKARNPNDDEEEDTSGSNNLANAPKKRISSGIQRLMSSLNFRGRLDNKREDNSLNPLQLDLYCNDNTETALHAAVKARHMDITAALLQAGANPNLPLFSSAVNHHSDQDLTGSDTTCLAVACQNHDVKIIDLLLKYGAHDNESKALKIAVQNGDEVLTAKLLSIKAHPDAEFKINKKAMTESPQQNSHFSALPNFGTVTHNNAVLPTTPTMINWHDQQCRLSQIRIQWLVDAALHVNKKLSNARNNEMILYSITRMDVSLNSLTSLPSGIFYLQSLRYLKFFVFIFIAKSCITMNF